MASNVEAVIAAARAKLQARLLVAGEYLADAMRVKVSQPSPPASEPGEPPHAVTGDFAASIQSVETEDGVRVGTDDPRGLFFELGTEKMAPRPWASSTLIEESTALRSIITGGV